MFKDLDLVEKQMGKTAQELAEKPNSLLDYAFKLYENQFGFKIKITNIHPARNAMKWLIDNYGEEAGDIIKWIFFKHDGKFEGEMFTYSMFTEKQRWKANKLYAEMKERKTRESKATTSSGGGGFFNAERFLNGFQSANRAAFAS